MQYLVAQCAICNMNNFHPIFAQVEVKPKGRNARDKPNETAFIVSADSKDKNGYQVGYIAQRELGCQDVFVGQVVFPPILAAIHSPDPERDARHSGSTVPGANAPVFCYFSSGTSSHCISSRLLLSVCCFAERADILQRRGAAQLPALSDIRRRQTM